MMKPTTIDQAIAALEAERAALQLAIDKLKALATAPAAPTLGPRPARAKRSYVRRTPVPEGTDL